MPNSDEQSSEETKAPKYVPAGKSISATMSRGTKHQSKTRNGVQKKSEAFTLNGLPLSTAHNPEMVETLFPETSLYTEPPELFAPPETNLRMGVHGPRLLAGLAAGAATLPAQIRLMDLISDIKKTPMSARGETILDDIVRAEKRVPLSGRLIIPSLLAKPLVDEMATARKEGDVESYNKARNVLMGGAGALAAMDVLEGIEQAGRAFALSTEAIRSGNPQMYKAAKEVLRSGATRKPIVGLGALVGLGLITAAMRPAARGVDSED